MIRTSNSIILLFLFCLTSFAGNAEETPEKALADKSDLMRKQVAELDLDMAKYMKTLKDQGVTSEEKHLVIKKMFSTFFCSFPSDCDDLVQTLSTILKDNGTSRSTKKWILQCFMTMGPKASKSESAVEHHIKNGKGYKDQAFFVLAMVAPKNDFFQKRMQEILKHPDVPERAKVNAAFKLAIAGHLDANVIGILQDEAAKRGELPSELLLHIAYHAEEMSEADRKRFLEAVKKPTNKKSYDARIKNYFRERMQGNMPEAIRYFRESLTFKSLEAATSLRHLSRLKKLEIKLLTPVLVDLMKQNKEMKSIAYLLADLEDGK